MIILLYQSILVILTDTIEFHKKLFILFKKEGERRGNKVKSEKKGLNCSCFHKYKNEIFSGRPISRLGAFHFVIIFVMLGFWAALFALVLSRKNIIFNAILGADV